MVKGQVVVCVFKSTSGHKGENDLDCDLGVVNALIGGYVRRQTAGCMGSCFIGFSKRWANKSESKQVRGYVQRRH